MNPLHILLADDHTLFRKGMINILKELRPQWAFSEAENGATATDLILCGNSIHIALLDVAMPVMNGIDACRQIKRARPEFPVIVLTQFDENSLIVHLLQLGINGYLLKNCDAELVVDAIERVMITGRYLSPQMNRAIEGSIGIAAEKKAKLDLSARDKEILKLLCSGMSTKEIASSLHLTETSIESYRKDLLQKTRTQNVAELISFVHRTGLLFAYSENKVITAPISVESNRMD